MEIINNLTPEDFKILFKRAFKFLINWDKEVVYYKNQEVYYNHVFYTSLINNNLDNQPDLNPQQWEETEDDYNSFITDEDIKEAFIEAKGNFNYNLFPGKENENLLKRAFLYLTAHYLVMDLSMSQGGGASAFIMTSKTVGSVSASYGVPQKILNNPLYSYLAGTQFGLKYLSYLYTRAVGNIHVVRGTTLPF